MGPVDAVGSPVRDTHLRRAPCGGVINEEGVVQSPLHPDRYFHNSNCTWVITAPEDKVVEIK